MIEKKLDALRHTDEYKALVAARSKIAWPLTFLMLGVYYAYILVIAFAPDVFAQKIGEGHTTVGIVVGLGVILFSFVLTGIYVHKANTVLEPMTEELHKKAEGL